MIIQQKQFKNSAWVDIKNGQSAISPQLVLVFGAGELISNNDRWDEIRQWYPDAAIVSMSTSGEIIDTSVNDETISVSALQFEKSYCKALSADISDVNETYQAGRTLAEHLPKQDLKHVLVFSDGLIVNGTDLARGIADQLPRGVTATGGMAGDADRFEKTYCGLNETPKQNKIVIVGLYGEINIQHGSFGGWDPFGVERIVTKSTGNVVFELDHQPILDLYKKYLGELASGLPGSGLLFPLDITEPGGKTKLVRTLLSINEEEGSVTYAGTVPEGSTAQLMKANFNRLIEGAEVAARDAYGTLTNSPDFALLVSCVGRKLVLKERTEEEIEVVKNIMGEDAAIAGFYSYGEIAPVDAISQVCELHNQTMTITTFNESV